MRVRNLFPVMPLLIAMRISGAGAEPDGAQPPRRPRIITLNDDGGWCWFQDERAIVHGGKLFAGSVANGSRDRGRRGNIEVTSLDLSAGEAAVSTLHENLEADDHASPALLARPDGRILAMYSRHNPDNCIHYRISSAPGDAAAWGEERVFIPSERSRVTYSNLCWLQSENSGKGRIYNFFRGLDNSFKPSWMLSDDLGETWKPGGLLIDFPSKFRHRPYVKYASDGKETIHFAFTEGHPRDFDNGIYHAFYRGGRLRQSGGEAIRELAGGAMEPSQATRVFAGDPDNVAWIHDLEIDGEGRPRLAYSVQKDSAGLPPRQGGQDHRYRIARWDGKGWRDFEVAHAGGRLYAGEDDYTGGISLHPGDADRAFISTNADPVTGKPLPGGRYEIFAGRTRDGGASWEWQPVTRGSGADNIRPVVPRSDDGRTALLWLRGTYSSYTRYDLAVEAMIDGIEQ